MDAIGHWAFGFICGTLIILPFIIDRSVFDYKSQKWVSVKWRKVEENTAKKKPKGAALRRKLR